MSEPAEIPVWKEELDAIIGARAYGQSREIIPRLQQLDQRYPNIAEINYQLAWSSDVIGQAQGALGYYEKAIALGLSPNDLSGALIGLGSILRTLKQLDRSAEVLCSGQTQFPENPEFAAFLCLTLHEQGRHAAAIQLAIDTLCVTADNPGLTTYQRALRHAAANLS